MANENGRPRDARIDSAVLDAAAALLGEVGYADLTVAAIADRAGTSRPAVYRRWPTKAHLIHEAAFRDSVTQEPPHTGVLDNDVRELVRLTAEFLTTPMARVAVPGRWRGRRRTRTPTARRAVLLAGLERGRGLRP